MLNRACRHDILEPSKGGGCMENENMTREEFSMLMELLLELLEDGKIDRVKEIIKKHIKSQEN